MSTETAIRDSIEQASTAVGRVWPLHSFVTANPLAGFEDRPFHEAVARGESLFGADGYPRAAVFRRAWEAGRIESEVLREELNRHGHDADPETLLDRMASEESAEERDSATSSDHVDHVLTKWLSAFLDQGGAEWPMPDRSKGFYSAFRSVARHDSEIPNGAVADLPDDPIEALADHLSEYSEAEWSSILEHHLTALPGWTGLIRQRVEDGDVWQSAYPITVPGYLAVRLALVTAFGAPIAPTDVSDHETPDPVDAAESAAAAPPAEAFLTAWEATYRDELSEAVAARSATLQDERDRPDAQMVFCIDTRSEVIRRHVESTGDYETYGYAGFFGIPMRYEGYDAATGTNACPPIVDPEHRIADRPSDDHDHRHEDHARWTAGFEAAEHLVESLKSNAATAFSFVETAGSGYGAALTARTLLPGRVHDVFDAVDERIPNPVEFCRPLLDPDHEAEPGAGTAADGGLPSGLTFDERVEYAATAFELMGWDEFARVVVFAGHTSETTNNPHESSLDCGACAGSPGGPNARVLATICNDDAVREALEARGIDIPEDTVFVAGEHNTTTDEVELFVDSTPESHAEDLDRLRRDLATAAESAAAERVASMDADASDPARETERRAADWAETRPEWGLAGNAGLVVGPRDLTADVDLNGRAFLHSYDWQTDPEGDALEAILTGPMVVTQWINAQYYFATVDTAAYGSGSKVTQNPVGNVGVYQGNGGDLMRGLPLQSLKQADDEPYHQPLRLSTVVHAPVDRVTEILSEHAQLVELLDNNWLSLTVVDPTQDHEAFHYDEERSWIGLAEREASTEPEPATAPVAADD
ncbi:MAG: DUF2309 domain-containing protein [Halobellus sp.]|uniref:DUF2309 domain-containing protein n=1 Tax=Halobellus sp. TaxID=1979212 RepID=UPI0035D4A89F